MLGAILNLLWGERLLRVEDLTLILRWGAAVKAIFHCFCFCLVRILTLCHEYIHHFPSFVLLEKYRTFLQTLIRSVCESHVHSLPPLWSIYNERSLTRTRAWVAISSRTTNYKSVRSECIWDSQTSQDKCLCDIWIRFL